MSFPSQPISPSLSETLMRWQTAITGTAMAQQISSIESLVYAPLEHSDIIRLIKIASTDELKCEIHRASLGRPSVSLMTRTVPSA